MSDTEKNKLEIWATRRHFANKKQRVVTKKKNFASGLLLSLDKPQSELDEILSPIITKYL